MTEANIEKGFINDNYYSLYANLVKYRGYRELYFEAEYNWMVINIETMKVYSLTEGDIYQEKFTNLESLLIECERIKIWHIEMESSTAIYGEMSFVMDDIKKLIKGDN